MTGSGRGPVVCCTQTPCPPVPDAADCDPDRELVLAVGNDRQSATPCELLGSPELGLDAGFATNAARVGNRDALRPALEERLITRESGARAAALTEVGVAAGVVNDIAAAVEHAREPGPAPTAGIERDDGTTVERTRNPIGLSVTPPSYWSAPPRFRDGRDVGPAAPAPHRHRQSPCWPLQLP